GDQLPAPLRDTGAAAAIIAPEATPAARCWWGSLPIRCLGFSHVFGETLGQDVVGGRGPRSRAGRAGGAAARGRLRCRDGGGRAGGAVQLRAGLAPDLILLDMFMPALDGSDVLDELKRLSGAAPAPVVITTGAALTPEWAAARGCAGFLRKPVEPDELLREV